MYQVIPSSNFKVIPWKNGLGQTIEMAISDDGTVDSFDWRISQATVNNDGEFSDFSGIERNLVLIKGLGISLLHRTKSEPIEHEYKQQDHLTKILDYANFDGGYLTYGKLHNGAIVDLNIMTAQHKYRTGILTFEFANQCEIPSADLVFIYSLTSDLVINDSEKSIAIDEGALVKMTHNKLGQYKVSGRQLIIVLMHKK